jgi:hypothetical protein
MDVLLLFLERTYDSEHQTLSITPALALNRDHAVFLMF